MKTHLKRLTSNGATKARIKIKIMDGLLGSAVSTAAIIGANRNGEGVNTSNSGATRIRRSNDRRVVNQPIMK